MGSKRSAAEKSAIVSGAGFLAAFWLAFERAAKEAGGSDEDLHRLGTEEGEETLRKMARVVTLRGECEIVAAEKESVLGESPIYRVMIDYSRLLKQMIAAVRYNSFGLSFSTDDFLFTGRGESVWVELHLVHLNKVASTDEVLAELDRRGLRPATLRELLALGVKYPNLQKEFPVVVALGTVWQQLSSGNPDATYRGYCVGWDDPGLDWVGSGDWEERCRFLAVRK